MISPKHFVPVTLLATASLALAATPAIGVAMSQGNISIDSANTAGNATLFQGSTLQTGKMASQIRLKDGAFLRLESASRAQIFSDHADLQEGSVRVSGYSANANGLSVRTEGPGSANVSIHGKVVEVAALTGNVHVFNAAGINVANLLPGRALNLIPQDAGASAASSLTGCVRTGEKSTLILTDETSSVTVQLRGKNPKAGRRVQISGAMVPNATPVAGASQVINVTDVKDRGACAAVATAGAAAAGAGAGAAGAAAGAAAGTVASVAATTTAVIVAGASIAGTAILTGVVVATNSDTTSPSTP